MAGLDRILLAMAHVHLPRGKPFSRRAGGPCLWCGGWASYPVPCRLPTLWHQPHRLEHPTFVSPMQSGAAFKPCSANCSQARPSPAVDRRGAHRPALILLLLHAFCSLLHLCLYKYLPRPKSLAASPFKPTRARNCTRVLVAVVTVLALAHHSSHHLAHHSRTTSSPPPLTPASIYSDYILPLRILRIPAQIQIQIQSNSTLLLSPALCPPWPQPTSSGRPSTASPVIVRLPKGHIARKPADWPISRRLECQSPRRRPTSTPLLRRHHMRPLPQPPVLASTCHLRLISTPTRPRARHQSAQEHNRDHTSPTSQQLNNLRRSEVAGVNVITSRHRLPDRLSRPRRAYQPRQASQMRPCAS